MHQWVFKHYPKHAACCFLWEVCGGTQVSSRMPLLSLALVPWSFTSLFKTRRGQVAEYPFLVLAEYPLSTAASLIMLVVTLGMSEPWWLTHRAVASALQNQLRHVHISRVQQVRRGRGIGRVTSDRCPAEAMGGVGGGYRNIAPEQGQLDPPWVLCTAQVCNWGWPWMSGVRVDQFRVFRASFYLFSPLRSSSVVYPFYRGRT